MDEREALRRAPEPEVTMALPDPNTVKVVNPFGPEISISDTRITFEPRAPQAAGEELERLQLENWQLRQACGYPIPADKETVNNPFRCGMCDARNQKPAPQPAASADVAAEFVLDFMPDVPDAGSRAYSAAAAVLAYAADPSLADRPDTPEPAPQPAAGEDAEAALARKDEALRLLSIGEPAAAGSAKPMAFKEWTRLIAKTALEDAPAPAEQEK